MYDAPGSWTNAFKRVVYFAALHPKSVVIAYHGDASVAKSFPHGNAKVTNRDYVRTQPHVLRDIEQTAGPARTVYQTLVTAGPFSIQDQRTAAPRDITQIRNVQSKQRNKSRLTSAGPATSSSASEADPDGDPHASVTERVASIVQTGRITLDPKLAFFTVIGTVDLRIVKLFPTTTCSCPADGGCYHVLAARMAVGLRDTNGLKRVINLTQLRPGADPGIFKRGGPRHPPERRRREHERRVWGVLPPKIFLKFRCVFLQSEAK